MYYSGCSMGMGSLPDVCIQIMRAAGQRDEGELGRPWVPMLQLLANIFLVAK